MCVTPCLTARISARSTREGVPIRVGDIATVSIGGDLRTGAASLNGDEAVMGTVLMRAGENSRTVSAEAAERLEEVRSSCRTGLSRRSSTTGLPSSMPRSRPSRRTSSKAPFW